MLRNIIGLLFILKFHTEGCQYRTLILSRHKQEERKSRNQDFKAPPACITISGQMESGSGALPGFKC